MRNERLPLTSAYIQQWNIYKIFGKQMTLNKNYMPTAKQSEYTYTNKQYAQS